MLLYNTHISDQDVIIDKRHDHLYAFKAISDPDNLYLHEHSKVYDWLKIHNTACSQANKTRAIYLTQPHLLNFFGNLHMLVHE